MGLLWRALGATQSTHSLFCLILARNVPVGEASVIVAVSAEHRKDTLDAVAYGIDTLKARVPIWKKVRKPACCCDCSLDPMSGEG